VPPPTSTGQDMHPNHSHEAKTAIRPGVERMPAANACAAVTGRAAAATVE
jgi:hypothetical protein